MLHVDLARVSCWVLEMGTSLPLRVRRVPVIFVPGLNTIVHVEFVGSFQIASFALEPSWKVELIDEEE